VGEILDSIKTIRTTQEHVNKYDKIIYLTINNVITQYIFKNSGGTILIDAKMKYTRRQSWLTFGDLQVQHIKINRQNYRRYKHKPKYNRTQLNDKTEATDGTQEKEPQSANIGNTEAKKVTKQLRQATAIRLCKNCWHLQSHNHDCCCIPVSMNVCAPDRRVAKSEESIMDLWTDVRTSCLKNSGTMIIKL